MNSSSREDRFRLVVENEFDSGHARNALLARIQNGATSSTVREEYIKIRVAQMLKDEAAHSEAQTRLLLKEKPEKSSFTWAKHALFAISVFSAILFYILVRR